MRRLAIVAAVLVVLVLAAAGAACWWVYSNVHSPHVHNKSNDFVRIEKGSTPKQIIAKLADEGIISRHRQRWSTFVLFGDARKLQAGEYQFDSPITPMQVL